MKLRPYQQHALEQCEARFEDVPSVCLVAPTGSGKTVMGATWLTDRPEIRGLWVVHRIELLRQSAAALARLVGASNVGVIAPGVPPTPGAAIQVSTVQTLLARGERPEADRVVLDECHHFAASEWRDLVAAYPEAKTLGLTATPERQDGRPLGDIFRAMVVAARYPQLVADGFLVPCKVYAPPKQLEANSLALDPLAAYRAHAEGGRAFVFTNRVSTAAALADQFNEAGIVAAAIHERTPAGDRRSSLAQYAAGSIRVLTNVYTLTEGVDIPEASTAILARPFRHVGSYLQAAGRVLRPADGKTHAVLIDLVGATFAHGMPTDDRVYSLDGVPIRSSTPSLWQCPSCGIVLPGRPAGACPECDFEAPIQTPKPTRIYSLALQQVYCGKETTHDAKRREFERLLEHADARGWDIGWVVREYKKLFFEDPSEFLAAVPPDKRRAAFHRFRATAIRNGWKSGYAAARYRDVFGSWPPYAWRSAS